MSHLCRDFDETGWVKRRTEMMKIGAMEGCHRKQSQCQRGCMEMAKVVMVWTQLGSAVAEDRMKMEAGTTVGLVEQQTQVKMIGVKTKSMRAGGREGAVEMRTEFEARMAEG
ncbi:hypothetical protein ACOMHN_051456 [Nucella lapillus]